MYKTSLSLTPLMVFDGNCQAHHLAAVFSASGVAEAFCIGEDYGFVPSYRGVGAQFTTLDEAGALVRAAKALGRPVYQVSQTTQMQEFLTAPYSAHVNKIVKFPFLQQYSIAPAEFTGVYNRNIDPSRLFSLDIKLIELLQQKASSAFDFASFLRDAGPNRPLFNTHNHPRGELTARLFAEVARQIPEVCEKEAIFIASDLARQEGINHVTVHPVANEIRSSLGYDWGDDYRAYVEMLTAASEQRWSDVLSMVDDQLLPIAGDTQMLIAAARAVTATGAREGRSWIFEKLTDLSPGFVHAWSLRQQFATAIGNANDAAKLRLQARSALGRSRYYSQVLAWLEIQSGAYQEALPFARDYWERTPDRPDAIFALAKALSLMGRTEEARAVFINHVRARGKADVVHFISFLTHLSELELDADSLMQAVE